jgi:carbon monoxide dehydrogenase subunit G
MDEQVFVQRVIAAPQDKVWAAVAGVDGLERWFPVIDGCRLEGSGVGCLRVLDLAGGGELRDRLIEIDDAAQRLVYDRIAHPFPTAKYIGRVHVHPHGEAAVLTWTVDLDVAPEQRAELRAFLTGAISDGVAGMAAELEGAPA